MKTIDEAREVLREGQTMLERNLAATEGQYHDAIDALRVALALFDEVMSENRALFAAQTAAAVGGPRCRVCGDWGHHECGPSRSMQLDDEDELRARRGYR